MKEAVKIFDCLYIFVISTEDSSFVFPTTVIDEQ